MPKSGVKLTRYLENSNTLSQKLNEQSCLSQVVNNLYRLHNSEFVFRNVFSVFDEFCQYFSLLENKSAFIKLILEWINFQLYFGNLKKSIKR